MTLGQVNSSLVSWCNPHSRKASSDISVIVKGTELGTVAIVSDLFQCQEDPEVPTWRAGSRNPVHQEMSRNKVLQMADYIVQVMGRCSKCPCKVDFDIKASYFLLCKECTVYLHVTLNSEVHLSSLQRKCTVWYAPYCWYDMFFILYVSYCGCCLYYIMYEWKWKVLSLI